MGTVRGTFIAALAAGMLFTGAVQATATIRQHRWIIFGPIQRHQLVSVNIERALDLFVRAIDLGELYHSPIDLLLAQDSVVQPDILFIRKDRLGTVGEKAILGALDLVVEILSDSTLRRDLVLKRRLYAAHGVREYWIVDPKSERVEVLVLEAGELAKKAAVTEGEVASMEALPGLRVALAEIFR